MKRLSFKETGLFYTLSPTRKPVASITPGSSLIIETEDATSGQIRKPGDVRDRSKIPYGNPLVGPIYVEGAKVGQTLVVTIKRVDPLAGMGSTYFSEFNETYFAGSSILKFAGAGFPQKTKVCTVDKESVVFSESITIPYDPMVGTIGVAPYLEEESISSGILPGKHGGNMDIPDIRPGATVFLPIFHPGGLLYIGDAHAAQGDGEISGTAIEMPAEIEIDVQLLDEKADFVRVESEEELISVATTNAGRGLEETIRTAFRNLTLFMEERYGIDRYEALMLCSQVAKIRIGNLWAAAAKIDKRYLG